MRSVGKIDRNIYKCITEDIRTDEVIITDEQIQHILTRHPDSYVNYSQYFSQIIADPDYILEDRLPYTAFILKEIKAEGIKLQAILRLSTSNDPSEYKNSIITFFTINDKRWTRYLRTRGILYKQE